VLDERLAPLTNLNPARLFVRVPPQRNSDDLTDKLLAVNAPMAIGRGTESTE